MIWTLDLLAALLLTLIALGAWAANVLGMPGNWVLVGVSVGCAWLVHESHFWQFDWIVVLAILFAAGVGELLEFAAGALGTSRLGGSKRSTALSLVGSIVGAIAGLFLGTPVPVVGNMIASLLLGGAGAFCGAIIGERWAGKDWETSIQVGNAAFWGRLLGTIGKAVCGTIACVLFLLAVWR